MEASTKTPLPGATERELALKLGALVLACFGGRGADDVVRVIDESGLSFVQMKALIALQAPAKTAPTVTGLAESLGVSAASASRAVDGLVRKRLASRLEDSDDRRVRRLGLTSKGRELADRVIAARLAGLEDFAGTLSADGAPQARGSARPAARAPGARRDLRDLREEGREPMTRYRHLITDDNRKWWTLGAMCFALFMVMLDNTVVNVALPSIQRDLDADIGDLEWVLNGYTLTFAVLIATGGRLGDIFGRRAMFLLGVVVFAAHLGYGGTGGQLGDADRLARGPGRRRGADDARDPLDRHPRLPGLASAARRSAPGPASRRSPSRSARWSAAS